MLFCYVFFPFLKKYLVCCKNITWREGKKYQPHQRVSTEQQTHKQPPTTDRRKMCIENLPGQHTAQRIGELTSHKEKKVAGESDDGERQTQVMIFEDSLKHPGTRAMRHEEWYINTTNVACLTTNRHVARALELCVCAGDSLNFFPSLCFIEVSRSCVFISAFFLLCTEEEKNKAERDTFENVYIFTMWHHPKKLRKSEK